MNPFDADDISVLCSSVGLGPSAYKRFARAKTRSPGTGDSTQESIPTSEPATSSVTATGSSTSHWKGLDAVFSHRTRTLRAHLTVRSATGGAGGSTMAATLARRLMMWGHSVLLVDSTDTPMLRHYFGAGDFSGGVCTLLDRHSRKGGRVHVVLRNTLPARAGNHWLRDGMAQAGDGCDYAIADMGTLMDGCSDSGFARSEQHLVVLTPDIRSAMAIPQLQQELEEREQRAGRPLQQAYVLNQYRPEARLHVELRDRFADQLGSRLIGVLRWSELVAEAVAQAQTIFDYAPESPAAEEFAALGNAVDGMLRQPEAMTARAGR